MKKPLGGLGRGLGSLIPKAADVAATPAPMSSIVVAPEGSLAVRDIPVDAIQENPYQPRTHFAEDELSTLAESIKEHGILQPLIVSETNGGCFQLVAGERRLRAARMLGMPTVPVIIRDADDEQKLAWALIENIQRADLNALEEARAYRQLIDEFHLRQDDVARRVGKSRPHIANTIRLLDLEPEIQRALEAGEISRSHAKTLLAEPDSGRRRTLFEAMRQGGVTIRRAEALVRSHTRRSHNAGDPNITALEQTLREKMGTKVEILLRDPSSGTVVIHFYSKEDLHALVAHLS